LGVSAWGVWFVLGLFIPTYGMFYANTTGQLNSLVMPFHLISKYYMSVGCIGLSLPHET